MLDQSFDLNGSDFTPLLTQVKAANANAFLSDAHLPDYITMHREYTQLGLKHKFVSYGARGPDQKGREALAAAADYLVAGLWWTPAFTDAGSQKFTETWKAKFNVTPDWFQALGCTPRACCSPGSPRPARWTGTRCVTRCPVSRSSPARWCRATKSASTRRASPGRATSWFENNLPGNEVALVWPSSIAGRAGHVADPGHHLMYEPSAIAGLFVTALLTAGPVRAQCPYGLALVYGVMRIINLAHAGTMMLSAFVVLSLNRAFDLDPILGAVVSAVVFFGLGMGLYRVAVRRVVNAPPIASLLLLFGVWLCAQNAAYLIWGSEDQSIVTSYTYTTLDIGDLKIAVTRLLPALIALVALAGLSWFCARPTWAKRFAP